MIYLKTGMFSLCPRVAILKISLQLLQINLDFYETLKLGSLGPK